MLEARGYVVVGEAGDGRTAISAAATLRPDAVLLDVDLPDMTGFAVAERLAATDAAPAVVLTSTHGADELGVGLTRCGARGFVAKAELAGPRLDELLRGAV